MRVWIAEKPSVGRSIAKALGPSPTGRSKGSISCKNGDIVTWAIGHLTRDFKPEDYDPRYAQWRLADLPIIPERFRRMPAEDKAEHLQLVTRLVHQASTIIIATDAGREGEKIAWDILEHAAYRGPVLRLWASATNDSYLAKAVHKLEDDKIYKPKFIAARLRSSMDAIVGFNYSRYYSLVSNNRGDVPCSTGRVQTAALAMLVDRTRARESFKSHPYYELAAAFDTPQGRLILHHRPSADKRILELREAEAKVASIRDLSTSLSVRQVQKNFSPPPPYSLPELQKAAEVKWGWTSAKTLKVLQELYDAGAVTYPRTDSGYLSPELIPDMPQHLAALRRRPEYRDITPAEPIIHKSIFDASKIEDHHGIIPTTDPINIANLGPDAEQIFDIIARRFIAALMPDAEGYTTTISASLNEIDFRTSGTVMTKPGWKIVWGQDGDSPENASSDDDEAPAENPRLPPVADGQTVTVNAAKVINCKTKAPAWYSESSLIKDMKAAGTRMENPEYKDLLGNAGIGTQATRHTIIETLKDRQYANRTGRTLKATDRGKAMVDIIRQDQLSIVNVEATALLERDLVAVEQEPHKAMAIWKKFTDQIVTDIARLKAGPRPARLPSCPKGGFTPDSSPSTKRSASKSSSKPRANTGPRRRSPTQKGKSQSARNAQY